MSERGWILTVLTGALVGFWLVVALALMTLLG